MQVQDEKIKGFSVLELIVVVVLIGIVSAIGYPNFTEWRKDREVRAAAVDIRSLIEGINAQVQRGQYVFVQVHVQAGTVDGGCSDDTVAEDEVTQEGICVTSKGMDAVTLGDKLNINNDFRDKPTERCNLTDTSYWSDDPSQGVEKIEVRRESFENIQTNWAPGNGDESIGGVCFGKNELWFSAAGKLSSGIGVPDYFLFLCSASEKRTNCEIGSDGYPTKYNKYLYSIEWSRFGNVTLSRYNFAKEDSVEGEWVEQ